MVAYQADSLRLNPENAAMDTVSFNCTACGKCCNSAPLLSVPELFYHETLFVGSLGLRRLRTHKAGDKLDWANQRQVLTAEDAQLWADTAAAQLFSPSTGQYYFALMPMAMDYDSLPGCPALGEDQHCTLQHNRKPKVCAMTPFDTLYPDSLQNMVLLHKGFDADCISNGAREGYQIVVQNRRVVDHDYQTALQQRRAELILEKSYWGNDVYTLLESQIFKNNNELARVPIDDGWLTISILPVLMVLAEISRPCAARCLQYVEAQIALIDSKITQAISKKCATDKLITKEFRFFREKYLHFKSYLLAKLEIRHFTNSAEQQERIDTLEKYLGITSATIR